MSQSEFKAKAQYTVFLIAFVFLVFAVFAIAPEVFLLVFAGVLVSVFLISLRDFVIRYTKFSEGLSLTIVVSILTLITVIVGLTVAPNIAEQFDELVKEIPKTLVSFKDQLKDYQWGQYLLENINPKKIMKGNGGTIKGFGGALSGLFGFLSNIVVILFIGLYGAVDPNLYKNGFVTLIPPAKRPRAQAVLKEVFETLKWWLVGQFFSMAVIGISITLGLWLLSVPLAFILGLIAALLTFIPNIGPVVAAVPAILLSLTNDPKTALYVTLLYVGTQVVESYFLTPLVQQKTIDLPPALILVTQVFFGMTLGILGLALAAPLTALIIVLTKMLYVEDHLSRS